MDGKRFVGIVLILSLVIPVSFHTIPSLTETNQTESGDQVQDQERLRVQDGSSTGDTLQEQERLRLYEREMNRECVGVHHRERQRMENRIEGEEGFKPHRYQHRSGDCEQGL